MARIGLLGGTFDPVHNGHVAIAQTVKKQLGLNKIIIIPTGDPPHKQEKDVTDKHHRLTMAKQVFLPLGYYEVSDYEIKKTTPSYSVDMLKHFISLYPYDEIYFIIGADSFRDIPTWWHYRELLTLCQIIVVSRPDTKKTELLSRFAGDELPPRVFYIGDVSYDISSTEIRELISSGGDISHLVPEAVQKYIKENNLYSK